MNAKKDAEILVNAILPFAEKMLKEHGEFYPYGGYATLEGKIIDVGADKAGEKYPKSTDLLKILKGSLQALAQSGKLAVAAMVFDVRVVIPGSNQKSDAIQVSVDHREGYSADIFYPYQLAEDGVIYGTPFAQAGKHYIFMTN